MTALFLHAQKITFFVNMKGTEVTAQCAQNFHALLLTKLLHKLGLSYSSVGIVITLWTVQRNRSSLQEENGFVHSQSFSPFLGPTQLPNIQWVPRNIFPDVNPRGHKADLSFLTSEWLSMSGAMPPFSNMPSCLKQEQLSLVIKLVEIARF